MKILSIVLFAVLVIGGAVLFFQGNAPESAVTSQNNISMVDGNQVIEIVAKGGYSPRVSVAKAGIPTILKMKTTGTFDCSSFLVIPSIGYRKNLPMSGETNISVPAQASGTTLQGVCGMGMYNFQVQFR